MNLNLTLLQLKYSSDKLRSTFDRNRSRTVDRPGIDHDGDWAVKSKIASLSRPFSRFGPNRGIVVNRVHLRARTRSTNWSLNGITLLVSAHLRNKVSTCARWTDKSMHATTASFLFRLFSVYVYLNLQIQRLHKKLEQRLTSLTLEIFSLNFF